MFSCQHIPPCQGWQIQGQVSDSSWTKKCFQPGSQHNYGCEEHRELLSTAALGYVRFLDLLQEPRDEEHPTAHFLFMWDTQLMKLHRHKTWKPCQRLCHLCSPPCVWISQANLHLSRMRWVWKKQSLCSHTGEVLSSLTFDGSRVSTSFTINHIHHPFQTFPLQPLARDLHSQGRRLALKETKFPQPFFFFLKNHFCVGSQLFLFCLQLSWEFVPYFVLRGSKYGCLNQFSALNSALNKWWQVLNIWLPCAMILIPQSSI